MGARVEFRPDLRKLFALALRCFAIQWPAWGCSRRIFDRSFASLSRSTSREPIHVTSSSVAMALRHLALPILPDWTGFVGLTEDGRVLWIPEEGQVSDPSDHVRHLALLRAGELYPE